MAFFTKWIREVSFREIFKQILIWPLKEAQMIRINNIINSKVKNKVKVCLLKKKKAFLFLHLFSSNIKDTWIHQSAAHRSPIFWGTLDAKKCKHPQKHYSLVRRREAHGCKKAWRLIHFNAKKAQARWSTTQWKEQFTKVKMWIF